jgi:hypothetical protein
VEKLLFNSYFDVALTPTGFISIHFEYVSTGSNGLLGNFEGGSFALCAM